MRNSEGGLRNVKSETNVKSVCLTGALRVTRRASELIERTVRKRAGGEEVGKGAAHGDGFSANMNSEFP